MQHDVQKIDLAPYFHYVLWLMNQIDDITIDHVPRGENKQVDALANLVATLTLLEREARFVPVCQR